MHTEQYNMGFLPALVGTMGQPLTMNSREIADLVESRHDNVKVAIERLSERGIVAFTATQEKSSGGRPGTVYHVNKRDSFVVVAQLCPEFTARLVDRWQKLEEEKANGTLALPDFTNPAEAARAWAAQFEAAQALMIENRAKDAVIGEMKPKADEYDAYLAIEGVVKIMDFCNKHGVKKNHPGYALRERHMLHQKKTLATQVGIRSGILRNVVSRDGFEYEDSKGNSVEAQTAMIVKDREADLLRMIIDGYGATAFRTLTAFQRAKLLLSDGGLA
ncbi:Rha family transcriptional regulator [Paracoccus denitrificans]|uniref:Rha family transcriptional regulator n=1 Tax=Paracoccus denitrificans TaxID=266 RepID=UPI001E4DF92C|nr:Rha family transcriptional regulator [Paracoccus denitrificans]UFS66562.1 Rha family transcriptional regulator [Paracoccus denitrificans]